MTPRPLVVAVDGGNSKTDVWVADTDGTVLATVRGPGFRPYRDGDGALDALTATLRRALDTAGSGDGPAGALVACLANVDLPEDETRTHAALVRLGLADRVEVHNDTFALLRAGAADGWGVAIVCGAGINCAGVAPDGREVRFPALGELTGDWGGGGQLAREALWSAVRAEDGRGPATALAAAVAAHFGCATATEVGVAMYRGALADERMHELPPLLMRLAGDGDAVARAVVERLAEEIAVLGTATLRRLGLLDVPAEVVLGGGVLTARDPGLLAAVERGYAASAPHARLVVVDVSPVLGAALRGLDLLNAAPSAHDRLRAAAHLRRTGLPRSHGARP
ncbi:MAG TPA: BadF/BadG/BcrA/BcrD ATPase family protein [Streptosporangiaceae bacterium]